MIQTLLITIMPLTIMVLGINPFYFNCLVFGHKSILATQLNMIELSSIFLTKGLSVCLFVDQTEHIIYKAHKPVHHLRDANGFVF